MPTSAPLQQALARGKEWVSQEGRRRSAALITVTVLLTGLGAAAAITLLTVGSEDAREVQAPDSDEDGVSDAFENAVLGTDPARARAHAVPEAWAHRFGLDVGDADLGARAAAYPIPPASPEVYGPRGLPAEYRMTVGEVYAYGMPDGWNESTSGIWDSGLDPTRVDVGDSGVPYAWLVHFGLDPFDVSQLDAVPSGTGVHWTPREAYETGLHPLSIDGDEDGLDDVEELRLHTSPRLFSTVGTGVADGWLVRHGLDPLDPAIVHADLAMSGMTILEKFEASMRLRPDDTLRSGGLDPRARSTSGGPIPDGWLVRHGLDPFDPSVHEHTTEEERIDGGVQRLTVWDEYTARRPPSWDDAENGPWWGGTDPRSNDTDEDGLTDLREIIGWNLTIGGRTKRVASDPTVVDTDDDGLPDAAEFAGTFGDLRFKPTDPAARDTDFDGLSDGEEVGSVTWRGIDFRGLDPANPDSDDDGLPDGDEADYWWSRYERLRDGGDYEWGPTPRPAAVDALSRGDGNGAAILREILPMGDVDGDGVPNILDPDSDNDVLLDGWEVRPRLYAESPYASDRPRVETDPANQDTDLDGLPDAWETAHGSWDDDIGGWNLDPSAWSSFGDDVSDADRDLDDDAIAWYSVHTAADGTLSARQNSYVATNRIEFEYASHPTRRSTSPDGIPDSWKIFWGFVYSTLIQEEIGDVYPGSPGPFAISPEHPLPRIGGDDSRVLASTDYRRYAKGGLTLPDEVSRPHPSVGAVHERSGTFEIDVHRAVELGLNPFLDDTDGDGIPDAWEGLWWNLGAGRTRVSPVAPDATADHDGDGIPLRVEWEAGGNPYEKDSDFGGVPDDIEHTLGLALDDPTDDVRATDASRDEDGDSVPDVLEILGFTGGSGTVVRTDPNDPDTDRDGLLDGPTLSSALGRRLNPEDAADGAVLDGLASRGLRVFRSADGLADVYGESAVGTDPTLRSTARDGVPDGWKVLHGLSPSASAPVFTSYSYGRPDWWNESSHGVWWWGVAPDEVPARDLDGDGLDDLNGEDPMPFANRRNALPLGDPRDEAISPLERLARAQAYGDRHEPAPDDPARRAQAVLHLDPLPSTLVINGSTRFSGRIVTSSDEPASLVPVILALGSSANAIGVAVSRPDGSFDGLIELGDALDAPPGSEGVTLFGSMRGDGVHENDPRSLRSISLDRPADVFAWSYNVSASSGPQAARSYALEGGGSAAALAGARTHARSVNLSVPTFIDLDVPASAPTGSRVRLNLSVTDALGRPLTAAVVTVDPLGLTLETDADGRASAEALLPPKAGPLEVRATFGGRPPALLASEAVREVRVLTPTVIELIPAPLPVQQGASAILVGRLLDGHGNLVAGAGVQVTSPGGVRTLTTNETGSFEALVDGAAAARPGAAAVTASYEGNTTLAPSHTEVTVRIVGAPKLVAEDAAANFGQNLVVAARLLDRDERPLVDRLLRFDSSAGAHVARTDAAGVARVTFLDTLPPGDHVVTVRFRGGDEGDAADASTATVISATRLAVDWPVVVRGLPSTVTGALHDATGAPLAHRPVNVSIGALHRSTLTGEDGRFEAVLHGTPQLSPGFSTGAIAFSGSPDGVHLAAHATSQVRVVDHIRLDVNTTVTRARPVLEGVAETLAGGPLVARDVRIVGPWGTVVVAVDGNGRLAAHLPIPTSHPLGPLPVEVGIEGSAFLVGVSQNVPLVLKDVASLHPTLPKSARPGEVVTVPYTLTASDGKVVPDATLGVVLGDVPLDVVQGEGVARFRIPNDAPAGPTRIVLRAKSEVASAPPVESVLIVRSPVTFKVVGIEPGAPGAPATVRIALTDGASGIPNATVVLRGAGSIPISSRTDASGHAVLVVPATSALAAEVLLEFPGEGNFQYAAATAVLLPANAETRKASLRPYAIGLLAVVAAGATGMLLMARHRRSPTLDALQRGARRLRRADADVEALYATYLELLLSLGLGEDDAESLTFRDLASRLVGLEPDEAPEAQTLQDVFDRSVYGGVRLGPDDLALAADALERLARRLRAAEERAHATAEATA